jgi:hypothetical protein
MEISLFHTCTPKPRKDILGHLYFVRFIVICISCIGPLLGIMPIPVYCEPRPVTRASLAVGLSSRRTGQGINTHDLCVRSIVTRLVIYPVTLCIFGALLL